MAGDREIIPIFVVYGDLPILSGAVQAALPDVTSASKLQVQVTGAYLPLSGGTLTGTLTVAAANGLVAQGDLDIGNFDFRCKAFYSDVTTGTAPMTVLSQTVVTNFNADLLDGQEGAYYLNSANFTGTNWTDLTDGGDTTLHTHDRGEGHIYIFPMGDHSVGQGTWNNFQVDANSIFNFWGGMTSIADGDNVTFNVYLAAGTYTLRLWTYTGTDRAVMDIYIDSDEVASFDLYDNPGARNVEFEETDIDVLSAGLKALKLVADGKNPLSTAYRILFNAILLYRTA